MSAATKNYLLAKDSSNVLYLMEYLILVQILHKNHHNFVLPNCLLAKKYLFSTQNKSYNTTQTCHVF